MIWVRSCLLLFLLSAVVTDSAAAQEAPELPFYLPTPVGWRTETLPFPLDFAPELEYEGLEELRFSSGMFTEIKSDFWSYAFIWWVPEGTSFSTDRLQTDLEAYFRGLNQEVAEARKFDPGDTEVKVQLEPTDTSSSEGPQWEGTARTVDVFATRRPILLNLRIDLAECPEQGHRAAFFQLSPQPRRHNIWGVMDSMRRDFRCER